MGLYMAPSDAKGHRQRLRERFIAGEDVSRTEEALLELLLCYAIPQKDVKPLAQQLIAEFGNLTNVLSSDFNRLCKIEGLKENSATLLKLIDWIRLHHGIKEELKTRADEIKFDQPSIFELPSQRVDEANSEKNSGKRTKKEKTHVTSQEKKIKKRQSVPPSRGSELFAKAVLAEGIELLPKLPETDSIEEVRQFLQNNLPFSSFETRRRYTSYVVRRLFPDGSVDHALKTFARNYADTQELRDVCFYRFCQVEQLMLAIIDDLILASIGTGYLKRDKLRDYLSERNPEAKSIRDSAQAVVEAFSASGFVKTDRVKVSFAYRNILLPSFAFIIHSEFPEPGMYDISKLEKNQAIRTLLWNPDRILSSLYELRNQGIIAKISEIDNIRQFTTRWTLAEVVDHLPRKSL